MAQIQTTIEVKDETAPNHQLSAIEFNELNDTINGNSQDSESRLSTLETDLPLIDSRLITIEGTSASVQTYEQVNLPVTALDGTFALNSTTNSIVYHRAGIWYRIADDTAILLGFTFDVKTDNAGTSNSDQFTLPLVSGNVYNFTVSWGDGNEDTITTDAPFTHTYATAGTYSITITGVIQGFKFDNGGDSDKLVEILDFGDLSFDSDASDAFRGCSNLVISATTGPNTSNSTNFFWFYSFCSSLTQIPLMDTSGGGSFFGTFSNCGLITSLPDFDLSNATTIRDTFSGCFSLTTVDNLNLVATSDMRSTFQSCRELTSIPNLDYSLANDLRSCFRELLAITTFPLIDTSNVTDFIETWKDCSNLVDFPLLDFSSGTVFTLTWQGCALNSASIDNIMSALVTNGAYNLSTSFASGTTLPYSSWSTQAQSDHATLISRGWTIATN